MGKKLMHGFSLVFLMLIACPPVYGNNFYVDALNGIDHPDHGTTQAEPWQTINYAMDFVRGTISDQQTIHVAEGTYAERVVGNIYVSLKGGYNPTTWEWNPDIHETIISAPTAGSVVVLSEGCGIEDFTIINGNRDHGAGIYCDNVTATISRCHITSNQGGSAVYIRSGSVQLVNNYINDNTVDAGINIVDATVSLFDNTISDNTSHGIVVNSSTLNLSGDRILSSCIRKYDDVFWVESRAWNMATSP